MTSCSPSCVEELCTFSLIECMEPFYEALPFMYEQRLWSYSHFYNAFITMMFTQNIYITFFWTAIYELAEEFSIFVSVRYNVTWIRLKSEWDPGDIMMDMLLGCFGIAFGLWVSRLFQFPRLIRFPRDEINRIKREYGLQVGYHKEDAPKRKEEDILSYSMFSLMGIQIKYIVELFVLQYGPSRFFLLLESGHNGEVLMGGCFRKDWISYAVTSILLIWVCFFLNRLSKFEKNIIWKNNGIRYLTYHVIWTAIFVIFNAPSICIFDYPKILLMYGLYSLAGAMFIVTVFMIYTGRYSPFESGGGGMSMMGLILSNLID